jgi:nitrogenase molybdenum-cofactor synthesis protein NifE
MGILWTISGIQNTAVLEFGSMGHLLYSDRFLQEYIGLDRATLYSTHINEKTIAFGIGKELELAIHDI